MREQWQTEQEGDMFPLNVLNAYPTKMKTARSQASWYLSMKDTPDLQESANFWSQGA